jgi:DNA-binding response OmpR family regulator
MSVVLIVEDDPAILRALRDNLEDEQHKVLTASDGELGFRMAREKTPDIVVLDLMLPTMSGLEICRKLRAEGFSAPILMVTARGDETDRVLGLDLGADDYVTKPFGIRELLARVRALLRRGRAAETAPDALRLGDIAVDFRKWVAQKGDAPLDLTRKEFGILRMLAAKAGEAVTREDLLNEVWGYENYPTTRTVDNHIASLRAKIEEDPAEPRRLVTVFGVGYRLIV